MKSNILIIIIFIVVAIVCVAGAININHALKADKETMNAIIAAEAVDTVWYGPGPEQIPYYSNNGKLIWYGHELIAHTSYYLGPKGVVMQTTNGMNCQNCHLNAGTIPYGNNYGKVFSTYPQFRTRSNTVQTIYARINDCFQRSLNGKALDTTSKEMQAIYAYMKWLGKDVPKGVARGGTGIMKLKYLNGAADPEKGKVIFLTVCASCHGNNGLGKLNADGNEYRYPPLWGEHSYNDGAGLFRLSNFAGFVKNNMPFGTDYHHPQLSDEDAWNVAAFVNSQPRPHIDQSYDYPNLLKKPVDCAFGPYADTFSTQHHKYGPFQPIKNAYKSN